MSLPDQSTTQSNKEIIDLDSMLKKILFALNPEGLEKEAPINLDRSLYLEERFAIRCKIPDSKLYYDIINHPTLGNLYIFYSPKAGCLYASINQKNNVCELFFLDRKYHYFSENNRQYCLLSQYIIPYRNTFYGKIDLNEKNPSINVYIQNETLKNTNLLNFTESSTDSNLNSQNLNFSEVNLTNSDQNSKINSEKKATFRDTLLPTFQKDSNKNNKHYKSEPIEKESQKVSEQSSNSAPNVKPPMDNSDNTNLKDNNKEEEGVCTVVTKGKQVIAPTGHTSLKNIEPYNNSENNQNLSSKSHNESLEKLDNSNSQSVQISDQENNTKNNSQKKTKNKPKNTKPEQYPNKKEEEDKLLEQEINKNKSKKEEDELLKKNLIKEKIAFNIKISSVYQNFLKERKENEPDNSDKKARIKQILKIFQEFKSNKKHIFYNFIDEMNKSHLKQKRDKKVKIINNLQTEEIFYNLQFFSLLTIDEENSKEIIRFLEFLTSDQFLKEYKKFSEKNIINFSEINFVQGDTQNIKNGFNWYNFLEFISYICVRHEDYSLFDKFIDCATRNEFKDFLFLTNPVLINSFFNFLKDKNNNQMNNFVENLNKNLNHVTEFYFKESINLNDEFYNNVITFLEFFHYSLEIRKKNPEDDKDDIEKFIEKSFEVLDKSCFKSEFDHVIKSKDLLFQMEFFINFLEKKCIKFLQNYNLYSDFFLNKDSLIEIYTNNDTWNVFNQEMDTRTKEIEDKIDSVISKIFEELNKKKINENKSDFEKELKEFNFSYYKSYYETVKNSNDSYNVELLNLESFENDTKFQKKFFTTIFFLTYKEVIECLKINPNRSYFFTMNFLIFIKKYLNKPDDYSIEKNKNFFTLCIAFLNTLHNQDYSNKNEELQKAELIILEEFINLVNSYSREFSEYLKSTKQQDSFIIENLKYISLNKILFK